MVYRFTGPDEYTRDGHRGTAVFDRRPPMSISLTSLPVAVGSAILDSIDFVGMVNNACTWDTKQTKVPPGEAAKAMVLTMMMNGYRPALENVNLRFANEPLELYFDNVRDHNDLNSDALARALDRIHKADPVSIFMSMSTALRMRFGITASAVHSDTTSVSVQGRYDVYDEEGNAYIRVRDPVSGESISVIDPDDPMHITYGYSKDRRPDLLQYMLGCCVDEHGVPLLFKTLDGNTSDKSWNSSCLELLESVLLDEQLVYVADSKLVDDRLVSAMLEKGILFLSRCPGNFHGSLLERTLMDADLGLLEPMDRTSPRKDAADRRVMEVPVDFDGTALRAVIVETSTFAGKADKAVEKETERFLKALDGFNTRYHCKKDAEDAFAKFRKKVSKGIFDVGAEFLHSVEEHRPRGRPRADGTDIRREDVWTVSVDYSVNPQKEESLRRRSSMIMLISNVPGPEEDRVHGLDAAGLMHLYSKEWRVEAMFRTHKRPMIVERLFIKDPGRADALVNVVNMAALLRAVMQVVMRRTLEGLDDDELPLLGRSNGKVQRNITVDYFVEQCANCMLYYDSGSGTYGLMNSRGQERAEGFLNLFGMDPDDLFRRS